VFGLGTEPWFRQPPYNGTPAGSLWRPAAPRAVALAILLPLALASGGCSFSYKLDSVFSPLSARAEPAATAAVTALPADADLAFAKVAAAEALGRAGDVSVPWENPGTGARGTVTPLASAYTQDGFTCRDFLASYVRKDSESWLQGEGCRIHQGRWEVRHMKPLKRP
jgi:17 kDa outer membrane surface antigen